MIYREGGAGAPDGVTREGGRWTLTYRCLPERGSCEISRRSNDVVLVARGPP